MLRQLALPLLLTVLSSTGLTLAQSGAQSGGQSNIQSGGAGANAVPAQLGASAVLKNAQGKVIGNVNFTSPTGSDSYVTVQVGIRPDANLQPGEYGFHVHQVDKCTPTFDAAGDHLNPEGKEHGLLNPKGPHAGDLPNVVVGQDGTTSYAVNTKLFTLEPGGAVFDQDGSAVMLHAQADDYVTDPSGNSGDRIACGVIEQENP